MSCDWTRLVGFGIVALVRRLGLLLLLGNLSAQDPGTEVPALLARLRHTAPDDVERSALVDAVLAAGGRGPRALFDMLDLDAAARRVVCRRQSESLQRNFERQTRRLLDKRLDAKTKALVETLRAEILKRSRGAPLEKQTIVAEIDPRLAELRKLLTVEVEQVLTANQELANAVQSFRGDCRSFAVVELQRQRAVAALVAAGERVGDKAAPAPNFVAEFEAALARIARAATPMSTRDAKVLAANQQLPLDAEEAAGVRELNDIRILVGLPALAIDVKLCAAARDHSADMVKLKFFSHTSPVPGKERFGQRAALAGTSASAENIAFGLATGAAAILGWWHSPGHHKNMMGDHVRVGLGRHERHWTQLFGG